MRMRKKGCSPTPSRRGEEFCCEIQPCCRQKIPWAQPVRTSLPPVLKVRRERVREALAQPGTGKTIRCNPDSTLRPNNHILDVRTLLGKKEVSITGATD